MGCILLHSIPQYAIMVLSNKKRKTIMIGRPKSKKGVKVHTAFKIYPDDKAQAQTMADKLDMSLSAYINKD